MVGAVGAVGAPVSSHSQEDEVGASSGENLQITIWSRFHPRHLTANLDFFLLFSVMQSVASLL